MPKERRKLPDRRKSPTKPLSRYILRGRRKKARRKDEDENYYVDWYESKYLFLILFILLLCILDAFFTFKILQLGGEELNPVMVFFIDKNPVVSLIIKYLITALSLVAILIHKNFFVFGRLRASFFIYVVFSLYLALILYEGYFYFTHFYS